MNTFQTNSGIWFTGTVPYDQISDVRKCHASRTTEHAATGPPHSIRDPARA